MVRSIVTARSAAVALAAVCVTTACSSGRAATPALPAPSPHQPTTSTSPTPKQAPVTKPHARPVAAALRPFADCTALLDTLRAEALDEVTPYGLQQLGFTRSGGIATGGDVMMAAPAAGGAAGSGTTGGSRSAGSAAMAPAAAPAPQGFSATNNQEAGVDEPDTVKTDGRVMVVIRQNPPTLELLDVTGNRPRQLGHLPVALQGGGLSLLMTGDTVVVLGQRYVGNGSLVVAEVYDVRDGAHPRHLRTFRVDGQLLDARFVHGRILLVTSSAPRLRFTSPARPDAASTRAALAANRTAIRHTDAHDWLPSVRVTPHGRSYPARCSQASHPGVRSGTTSTSIVTLDPDADAPTSNQTVVGGSDLLYASSSALYLATSSWQSQALMARGLSRGVTTDLHGFDIRDPDKPAYLGTGSLPGTLVDRYALSEDHGYLRVATTVGEAVPPVGEGLAPSTALLSDNRVTVLKPVDGVLRKVGEVRGLGRGQRIFGVRFLGDIGYVVTFRSIDPLYTLDLSDPQHPMTKGALHISGYSSALYPLATGRLLGVGQAVGAHQQQLGAQAEVFDVSSLARPRLTGKLVWANAFSPAANDHHSLLWWAPKNLVVMPLSGYSGASSAVVLRVGTTGRLTELGRVRSPASGDNRCCGAGITRALVVGDLLYSITDDGVVTNPLDEVDQQRWLPFR